MIQQKLTFGLALALVGPFSTTVIGQDRARVRPDAEGPPRVATAEIGFALDLYKALALGPMAGDGDDNVVVGSVSLHTALAMTAAGATGETREQLDRLLRLSRDFDAKDWAAFRAALKPRMLLHPNDDTRRPSFGFDAANQVFGQVGIAWHGPFQDLLSERFGARLVDIDFRDAELARQRINSWVAEHTNDRIDNLIGEGVLTPDVRMALVNACTFHAAWETPFSSRRTADAVFTTPDGEEVRVPTLHGSLRGGLGRIPGGLVVDLPFEGSDTSMLLMLPDRHDGLPALEAQLDAAFYAKALAALESSRIDLALPKLDLGTKADVGELLKQLGAQRAFTSEAQFDGMADTALMIGPVLHEAQLTLDEKGVEAVAATAVLMLRGSIETEPPQKVSVDRPFWFALRHRRTGTLLFTGRVTDPSSAKG